MTDSQRAPHVVNQFRTAGVALLVVGAVLAGLGLSQGIPELGKSYLYGWVTLSSITLGCFSLSLLFHITRGRWGTPLLRLFEAGGGPVALGVTLVLFLPIAFVFKDGLYEHWLHPAAGDMVLARKSSYLNYNFWLLRTIGVQLVFVAIAAALRTWTLKEELTGDKRYSDKRNNFAPPAMVAYFLLSTFLVTDVVMSLDPHWFSTIFASIFAVGNALFAMAFCVFVVLFNRKKAAYQAIAEDPLFLKDFGNLLLMLVMVWTYFTFSQLLIIWSGNLPTLTSYYRARTTGNYGVLGFSQLAFNFALPFIALITVAIKRYPVWIMAVAAFVVVFRLIDLHYQILPFLRPSLSPSPADIGFVLALLGAWGITFSIGLGSAGAIVSAHPYQDRNGNQEANAHA